MFGIENLVPAVGGKVVEGRVYNRSDVPLADVCFQQRTA